MNCTPFRDDLTAYLDRELSPAEHAGVESHLGSCAACRREVERLRRSYDLLAVLEAPAVPAGFTQRFWRRAGRGARRPVLRWALPLAVAAAAAIVVAVLVLGTSDPGTSTQPTPVAEPGQPDRPVEQAHARLSPQERQIVENLHVLAHEDFEAARQLEVLDRLDAAEELDEETLEALGGRSGR